MLPARADGSHGLVTMTECIGVNTDSTRALGAGERIEIQYALQ
jgi:hypothetical protein